MTVSIELSKTPFGESYILIATLDRFHKPLFREFYAYHDAEVLAARLFLQPLEPDIYGMFTRKSK